MVIAGTVSLCSRADAPAEGVVAHFTIDCVFLELTRRGFDSCLLQSVCAIGQAAFARQFALEAVGVEADSIVQIREPPRPGGEAIRRSFVLLSPFESG